MTHILLAGATGLVGHHALALLLADARVTQIVAPTRRPLPAHDKLLNPIMESTDIQPDADWWRVDGVICALGTTRKKAGSAEAFRAIDHDYVLAIAARLRSAGATRFALTSSVGASARSPVLYTRTKGEVEDAIVRLGFPSLTIVRPGFLDGDRDENRPMERIMGRLLRFAAPLLPASARVSPAATVAALLVEAAIAGEMGTQIVTPADITRASALS